MFSAVDQRRFFRSGMRGACIRIGCFSIVIHVQSRETELIDQIADLYGSYPQGVLDELPDFAIALRSRNTLPFRRRIQADLSGYARYPAVPPRLGLPMLESGLNWLVWTSIARFALFHAAALERQGQAIILPGPSGAGKSTLCAALAARGWRLLSDEVAMVRPRDGLLQPYPRPISLKNESIEMIARRVPGACFSRRFDDTTKGTVAFMRAPPDAIARADIPAGPLIVVFPRYAGGAPVEIAPVEKAQAFMRLVDHSSNYLTLLETGFETLASLVEACDHYVLTYGALDDAVSVIEDLVPARRGTPHVGR
jgi:HprK-related kinase A